MAKKRTWKFWTSRIILGIILVGLIWVINLIWFRPFNIENFYDKAFIEIAVQSPELTTSLGIPVLYDVSKDELDDISDAKNWESFNHTKENYETLMSYDFESQSQANKLNTKILAHFLKTMVDGEPYFYHGYPVNQMVGVQSQLPSMMESAHKLRDKSDIEAYVARLSKFNIKFNQLIETLTIAENKGIIPPRFVIDRVLDEMNGFVGADTDVNNALPATQSNILYTNFSTKIDTLADLSQDEKDNYKRQVEQEIETTVFEAYGALIEYFEQLRTKATTDDGVWKLPNGEAYYRYKLKEQTTTELDPEEVHQIGLAELARIKGEMQAILDAEGYSDSTKTLGMIIQELNAEERFLYPNTDEGRQMVLD